jgi:thioesterase domain-containing protein
MTVRRLSELVVPLQPKGAQPPVFLLHPIGGTVFCYLPFAQTLQGRPVYGVQSRGLVGDVTPLDDLREMATRYREAVRTVQPEGELLLMGWSMGGLLAYEMAHQERASGRSVCPPIMIDTAATIAFNVMPEEPRLRDRLLLEFFLRDLVGIPTTVSAALSDRELADQSASAQLGHLFERGAFPRGLTRAELERLFRVFRANVMAEQGYEPPPSEEMAYLIRAEQPLLGSDAHSDYGWRALCPKLFSAVVPGDHYTVMRPPGVNAVGDVVGRLLPPTVSR